MTLLSLVLVLVVLGVGLYLLNAYAPLDGKIKTVINVVVVVAAVLFAASAFGLCSNIAVSMPVPQLTGN